MNNGCIVLYLFVDIYFDVVLMDICMLEMDGIKVLKEMCSYEIWIFVILMMVYVEVEIVVEVLCCGVFDYVIKLFDFDELNLIV